MTGRSRGAPADRSETATDVTATGLEATLFAAATRDDASARPEGAVISGRVGRYVMIERVGAGAMGVVYSAYDPELDRKVAIKLLKPGRVDESLQLRLVREAQAMARLSHPNVVHVHDVGRHGDQVFIAMEFVRGQPLGRWLRMCVDPPPWREMVDLFLQAGRGLGSRDLCGDDPPRDPPPVLGCFVRSQPFAPEMT